MVEEEPPTAMPTSGARVPNIARGRSPVLVLLLTLTRAASGRVLSLSRADAGAFQRLVATEAMWELAAQFQHSVKTSLGRVGRGLGFSETPSATATAIEAVGGAGLVSIEVIVIGLETAAAADAAELFDPGRLRFELSGERDQVHLWRLTTQ